MVIRGAFRKILTFSNFIFYSVEISEFFLSLLFYVESLCGIPWVPKIAIFEALKSEFEDFLQFFRAEIFQEQISEPQLKVRFFQESNSPLWFPPHLNFPPKRRHQISWTCHVSRYPKPQKINFWQFQKDKTSDLAKFNKLKCQYL